MCALRSGQWPEPRREAEESAGRKTTSVDPHPEAGELPDLSLMSGGKSSEPAPARKKATLIADARKIQQAKIAAAKASLQDAKRLLAGTRAKAQSLEATLKKAKAEAKEAARRAQTVAAEAEAATHAFEAAKRTFEEATKELESLLVNYQVAPQQTPSHSRAGQDLIRECAHLTNC